MNRLPILLILLSTFAWALVVCDPSSAQPVLDQLDAVNLHVRFGSREPFESDRKLKSELKALDIYEPTLRRNVVALLQRNSIDVIAENGTGEDKRNTPSLEVTVWFRYARSPWVDDMYAFDTRVRLVEKVRPVRNPGNVISATTWHREVTNGLFRKAEAHSFYRSVVDEISDFTEYVRSSSSSN